MRTLAFFVCGSLLLAGCDDTSRITVAGVDFCGPQAMIVKADWWIPKSLLESGFAFDLPAQFYSSHPAIEPARDIKGRPIPLSGLVEPAVRYEHWERPVTGYYQDQIIQALRSGHLRSNQRARIFLTEKKDEWLWWEPAADYPKAQIDPPGRLLAVCKEGSQGSDANAGEASKTCQRFVMFGSVAIGYRFNEANLVRLQNLDEAVISHVRTWQCSGGG